MYITKGLHRAMLNIVLLEYAQFLCVLHADLETAGWGILGGFLCMCLLWSLSS